MMVGMVVIPKLYARRYALLSSVEKGDFIREGDVVVVQVVVVPQSPS